MNEKIEKIVEELKIALRKEFEEFEGLYVYGSQVMETATIESDVDIVGIIDASDTDKRYKIWGVVSRLEYKYDICIDFHPYTRKELERNYMFHDAVVKKGVFYASV